MKKPRKPKLLPGIDWIYLDTKTKHFKCKFCKISVPLQMPCTAEELLKAMRNFQTAHKNCGPQKPTHR